MTTGISVGEAGAAFLLESVALVLTWLILLFSVKVAIKENP